MGGDEAIPGVDDAVQASIILLANEGGAPVTGRIKMQRMVLALLKNAASIPCTDRRVPLDGEALDGEALDGKAVDREPRYLSRTGAVRCGRSQIEITAAGRAPAESLLEGIDGRSLALLRDAKWFFNDMTDGEALAHARAAYPDAGADPDSSGAAQDAEWHMIALIGKDKITSERAAEPLRRDQADVMRRMGAAGMPALR